MYPCSWKSTGIWPNFHGYYPWGALSLFHSPWRRLAEGAKGQGNRCNRSSPRPSKLAIWLVVWFWTPAPHTSTGNLVVRRPKGPWLLEENLRTQLRLLHTYNLCLISPLKHGISFAIQYTPTFLRWPWVQRETGTGCGRWAVGGGTSPTSLSGLRP